MHENQTINDLLTEIDVKRLTHRVLRCTDIIRELHSNSSTGQCQPSASLKVNTQGLGGHQALELQLDCMETELRILQKHLTKTNSLNKTQCNKRQRKKFREEQLELQKEMKKIMNSQEKNQMIMLRELQKSQQLLMEREAEIQRTRNCTSQIIAQHNDEHYKHLQLLDFIAADRRRSRPYLSTTPQHSESARLERSYSLQSPHSSTEISIHRTCPCSNCSLTRFSFPNHETRASCHSNPLQNYYR